VKRAFIFPPFDHRFLTRKANSRAEGQTKLFIQERDGSALEVISESTTLMILLR